MVSESSVCLYIQVKVNAGMSGTTILQDPPPTLNLTTAFRFDETFENTLEIVLSVSSMIFFVPAAYIVVRIIWIKLNTPLLKGSFYTLFVVFGSVDLLLYVAQMLALRAPYWGVLLFYEKIMVGIIPTLLYFFALAFAYLQVFGCVCLAANRATVLLLPLTYEKFWKRYLWIFLLAAVVFTLCMTSPVLFVGGGFVRTGPAAFIIGGAGKSYTDFGLTLVYVYLAGCSVALFLNAYTGYNIFVALKSCNKLKRATECKFFYITTSMFLCQACMAVKQYLVFFAPPQSPLQLAALTVGPVLTDINSLLPMFSLVVLSAEVRKLVFPFGKKK